MNLSEYERMFALEADHFWFRGKLDLVLKLLARYLPAGSVPRILDLGCGTGINLKSFERLGFAVGADSVEPALKFCRSRGISRLARSEAQALPFKDRGFDAVLALDLIEHVRDDRRVIAEAARVLRPGGRLLVTVPAFPFLFSAHDRALGHFRRYRKAELLEVLTGGGLELEKISYFNFFLFFPIFLFRVFRRKSPAESGSDLFRLPDFINAYLYLLLNLETLVVLKSGLPLGVSLVAVVRKPSGK
ncbi:MAG: class I SAM-dependent methyltransferase [bacterium]|nr:class I SAM-dependent methyltransferase [bacterium]